MDLRNYLLKNDLTVREFAETNEIGIQNVYYWLRGKFRPNKFYQKILREVTKGKVTEKDWK